MDFIVQNHFTIGVLLMLIGLIVSLPPFWRKQLVVYPSRQWRKVSVLVGFIFFLFGLVFLLLIR